jgi:ABC-type antimicrobial peptide transport system permease subunit
MLGVILGVAALASTFAFVEGMFTGWQESIKDDGGIEKLWAEREPVPDEQQPYRHIARQRRLEDVRAVQANVADVSVFSPEVMIWGARVHYHDKSTWCRVQGVTEGTLPINNYAVEKGRFIADIDRQKRLNVAVLGSAIADDLYGRNAPVLGRRVFISSKPYRVIGVLQSKARTGRRSGRWRDWRDRLVYIPLETCLDRMLGRDELEWLNFRVEDPSRVDAVSELIQNVLFFTHRRIACFSIRTNEEMVERFLTITTAFDITMTLIAGISLVVGGIGIMNIMLASINERIRQIGIRKAIGARDRDVMIQVLVESIFLSLLGGLLGIVVSLVLTQAIEHIMRETWFGDSVVRVGPLMLAFSVSVLVGIIFGLYPALKASRLDPIEALRYE